MNLDDWNQRLHSHFKGLKGARELLTLRIATPPPPIFALEHGLTSEELKALAGELRSHIKITSPSDRHQLAWIVYASEIGYQYAGDEYWQTFEAKTPRWTSNGRRGWIRDAFVDFQKRFAGAKPSGPWAEQFSIIAWPITHAILPRDLQQQLAKVLYGLRHSFSAELFDEPRHLGEFIAAESSGTSARFRNLVQAPELVGQVAAALLLGGNTLLHPATLARIGQDVERERRSREWLSGARRVAKARATIRGLAFGRPTSARPPQHDRAREARAEVERLGIEPRLALRPIGESRWEVSLEVPDLSHLLLRFPQMRDVLSDSRCVVAGAAGRPLARGRCLHGPQRVQLARWPQPAEVLLKFERADAELEYMLRAECMLRPGSRWLFKVASDGLAYESRGMRVRPGSRYVLVSTEPFPRPSLTPPVALMCEGVHAALLEVPSPLTPEWEEALTALQVTHARSIEVWPAGLAAVAWDGDGHGEWLASETPILGIRSDHAMDELVITMADVPTLTLSLADESPGEPIFVELPPLSLGLHRLGIAARATRGADLGVLGEVQVVMRVRESRPWSSSVHRPLEVELDPATPSLEQLWEGRASVEVRGPTGRDATCHVRVYARSDGQLCFDKELPALQLPVSRTKWAEHIEVHVKNNREIQRVYDQARMCEIEIAAEELGSFTILLERSFEPLRWDLRRNAKGYLAHLVDDTDRDTQTPLVQYYSFDFPTIGETLTGGPTHAVPRNGGLLLARTGDFESGIVAPPIPSGLSELNCTPTVDTGYDMLAVEQLVSLSTIWSRSRLPGESLAGLWRRTVLREFTSKLSVALAGSDWEEFESYRIDERGKEEVGRGAVLRACSREARENVKAFVSPASTLDFANEPLWRRCDIFRAFVDMMGHLDGDLSRIPAAWIAEFSLRLSSDPATVKDWAEQRIVEGLQVLFDHREIIRAARFLVVAVDRLRSTPIDGEVFAGWRWT